MTLACVQLSDLLTVGETARSITLIFWAFPVWAKNCMRHQDRRLVRERFFLKIAKTDPRWFDELKSEKL